MQKTRHFYSRRLRNLLFNRALSDVLSAIYWAHISKIYYAATKDDAAYGGFDDDFIYKELDLEKTKRKIPAINFLQEEGRKVFDIWLKTENKIDY